MITEGFNNVNDIYNNFIATTAPEVPVFCFNDKQVNKQELEILVDSTTKHLIKLGVRKGSIVGYTFPNCLEVFPVFIAISRLGACAIPLFHMIPDAAKAGIYAMAKAQFVITTAQQFDGFNEHAEKMQAQFKIATIDECPKAVYSFPLEDIGAISLDGTVLTETDPKLPLLIASSSGTTGTPKIVIMTQSNIASEQYIAKELTLPLFEDNNLSVIAFPLSTAGVIVCLGSLFSDICQVYSSEVSPVAFMKLVSKWKPSYLACPPAYYEALLSLPMLSTFDLTSVKRITVGMDFLTPSLVERLKEKFVNLEGFSNGYGLIETTNVFMICKSLVEKDLLSAPTSKMMVACNANKILVKDENGNQVEPGSEGELYVKGANVVGGYINNAEESAASFNNGWFRTGDIVRYESENTVTLLGRKKYLIKRGGKSVSPIIVQNKLNELEGIKNSAVVGIPHPLYGEMVWAFVVKTDNADIEFKDIMKHCRTHLVNYMVPDQIMFIDEIPKNTGVGKVNYEQLKEIANKELKTIEGDK